jgi:hypothetical protein
LDDQKINQFLPLLCNHSIGDFITAAMDMSIDKNICKLKDTLEIK